MASHNETILWEEESFQLHVGRKKMNDLPVIGYPCLRKELWDRQGANIASR